MIHNYLLVHNIILSCDLGYNINRAAYIHILVESGCFILRNNTALKIFIAKHLEICLRSYFNLRLRDNYTVHGY